MRVRLSVLISAAPAIFLSRELRVPDNFIVQAPATLMRAYSQSLKWMFPSLLPAVSICVDFVLVNPRFSSLAPAVDIVVLSHDKFLMLRLQAPASLLMNELVDNEFKQLEYETAYKILEKKIESLEISKQDIDDEVIEYIAQNYSSDVRKLEGALNRLIFYTINVKHLTRIDIDTIKESVSGISKPQKQNKQIVEDDIINNLNNVETINIET